VAYRGRPYGLAAYSWGPYSTWRFPDLGVLGLGGRSGAAGAVALAPVLEIVAGLGGRSGVLAGASLMPIHIVAAGMGGRSGVAGLASKVFSVTVRLGGVSGVFARASADVVLKLGPLTGRSSTHLPLRFFWEEEPPSECGGEWLPGVPCDAVWTPAAACDAVWAVPVACTVTWGGQAGEDVPWAPLPAPPYLCPELEAADG